MKGIIIFTSKTGVTQDVAKYIQSKLHFDIELVDVSKKIKEMDVSSYDFCIVGSPTYISMASKQVKDFVRSNIQTLLSRSLYIFMIGANDEVNLTETLPQSYPQEIVSHAKVSEFLGGELRYDKLGFLKRFLLQQIEKAKVKENPNHKSPSIFWDKVDQFCIDLENDLSSK